MKNTFLFLLLLVPSIVFADHFYFGTKDVNGALADLERQGYKIKDLRMDKDLYYYIIVYE